MERKRRGETSMKPIPEILDRIAKNSKEHPDGVFTRLYRYLLGEEMYETSCQTKPITNNATSIYKKELIQKLKNGTYQAKPIKQEAIFLKNGTWYLLGISSLEDKLLQEAVRKILETIYEPIFHPSSHGFRPNRSCHTALDQISSDFTETIWFLQGERWDFFDHVEEKELMEILQRKIPDRKFLAVIRQFLKVGYWREKKEQNPYHEIPQSSIGSILANIYWNE